MPAAPPSPPVFNVPPSAVGPALAPKPGTDPCPRCDGTGRVRKVQQAQAKVNNGCGHPIIRRLGTKCQDCGAVVGASPLGKR